MDDKYKKVKISVVIPAYNAENTIERAVYSALNQTHKNIEIIIINDASTDHTEDIVKNINCDNANIVYLRNSSNLGVANSRNRGIRASTGNFIAFLDADDKWRKNKCQQQIQFMLRHKLDFSSTSYIKSTGTENIIVKTPKKFSLERLYVRNPIGLSSVMVTKSIMQQFQFNDIGHEDMDLWVRLFKHKKKFGSLDRPLVTYFATKGSRSSNMLRSYLWHAQVLFKNRLSAIEILKYQILYTYDVLRKKASKTICFF